MRWLGMCLAVSLTACRQENPDWMGPDPSAGGDAGSSGAATSGTSTEPATSAVGSGSDGPTCDPDTQMLCGTTCRNILDDRKNCGDCGVMCTANDQCIDGVCG